VFFVVGAVWGVRSGLFLVAVRALGKFFGGRVGAGW